MQLEKTLQSMSKFKEVDEDLRILVRDTKERLKDFSPPLSQNDDIEVLKKKMLALNLLREDVTPKSQQKLTQLKELAPKLPSHLHANDATQQAFDQKLNLQSEFEACLEFLTHSLSNLSEYDRQIGQIRQILTQNSDKMSSQSSPTVGGLDQKKDRLHKLEELLSSTKVLDQNLSRCDTLANKLKLQKCNDDVVQLKRILTKQHDELIILVDKLRQEVADETEVGQQTSELVQWMNDIRAKIEFNAQLSGTKEDLALRLKHLQV